MAPVVDGYKRYQYMIDRKRTQYVILYVNHNIPSTVHWDPKVSVLLWLERRRRRVKDTPKAMHQWCFRGIFQVVDWKTHRNANTSSGSKTKIF